MSYKVSFFLWAIGGIFMLAAVFCILLGDKTPTGTVLWLIGLTVVFASMLPRKKEKV